MSAEFAIRLASVHDLFWEVDARALAERTVTADVRWHLLDEWERVRDGEPGTLVVYAPASERASTDEDAVRTALRTSLERASGPLRRVDPLSRHENVVEVMPHVFNRRRFAEFADIDVRFDWV